MPWRDTCWNFDDEESCGVSPEARARLDAEFERLAEERKVMQPLFDELRDRDPNPIELRAVAATLHTVYTGIELILKTVHREVQARPLDPDGWHADLLFWASEPSDQAGPIIEDDLLVELRGLMGFRHVFRNVYGHQLEWDEMREGAFTAFATADAFMRAVNAYVADLGED